MLFIGAVWLVAAAVAGIWTGHVTSLYIPYSEYDVAFRDHTTLAAASDYHLQKAHLLKNPSIIFPLAFNALTLKPEFILKGYIGQFGTYLDVEVAAGVSIAAFLLLILTSLAEQPVLTLRQRLTALITAAAVYLLMVVSHHLTWNAVGSPRMDSLQGRYFIPLLPLVWIALPGFSRTRNWGLFLVGLCIAVVNIAALSVICDRYFGNDYEIQRTHPSTAATVRDTVIFATLNVSRGDIVTIKVEKKGIGEVFARSAESECDMRNGREHYTDRDGWQHVQMDAYIDGTCAVLKAGYLSGGQAVLIRNPQVVLRKRR
jgi:hypothetical protein